jgi:uncharacterized protein (TIRG00374 family)
MPRNEEHHGMSQLSLLKGRLAFAGKILVTIAFCVFIYSNVDWPAAWRAVQTVRPEMLVVVFAGMLMNVAVSTWKWKLLLSIHSIFYSFPSLYRYYLIGSFFNNFLPSTIGGDGYRIYKTVRNPVSQSGAVGAVFMERITGLLALLITGWIGAVVSFFCTGNEVARLMMLWGAGITLFALICLTVFRKMPTDWLGWFIARVPEKIRLALSCFRDYGRYPGGLALVLLLSLFFQFFLLILYLLLFNEVAGHPVSIFAMAVAVCVSTLVSLLPVSINGLGLLDGSFIYLLSTFHVSYENGLIVMLLIRLLTYVQSLVGGIFYFFEKKSRPPTGNQVS